MAIYDMIHNAKSLSLEEILDRQRAIDGADLKNLPIDNNTQKEAWNSSLSKDRLEFLEEFHKYCRQADLRTQTWSNWNQNHSS